ncbi:hypothetical protein D3C80_1096360 [compost metagenome]
MDCKAAQVLFIEDTPHADVEGPQAIGISTRLIERDNGQSLMEILAELLALSMNIAVAIPAFSFRSTLSACPFVSKILVAI